MYNYQLEHLKELEKQGIAEVLSALVLVRWPRQGRFLRWRVPRKDWISTRRLMSRATLRRMEDVICPPQTQCAVYNNLHCQKKRYLFPGYGHEEIAEFDDMLLDFFCKEEAVL